MQVLEATGHGLLQQTPTWCFLQTRRRSRYHSKERHWHYHEIHGVFGENQLYPRRRPEIRNPVVSPSTGFP
ncbi:hypothetical protein F3A59_23755, partial [Salmonella enterica subsp. enterica serovar Typhi]|nr:hypothetical protein [Salmonella enterica subsp. enterica serovar Typhi]